MKLLILSDSHGDVCSMGQAVQLEKPDRIIHLGDCWRDGEKLAEQYREIPLVQVPGNCDFMPELPQEKLLRLNGQTIFLCHGHTYGVKQSLLRGAYAAEEQGAGLFLFGHTHRPFCEQRGRVLLLNPGSVRDGFYGVISLEGESMVPQLKKLP